MHLPKNIPLKAALLTLALAASHVAHAATFQDEAIAFATNNPMSLTVKGDDVTVNLTTNISLLPGVHVEQNDEAPCPIGLTTTNENGNDTLTIKRVDSTQPCKAVVVVNLPEKSSVGFTQRTPSIDAKGNFGKITTHAEHMSLTFDGRADSQIVEDVVVLGGPLPVGGQRVPGEVGQGESAGQVEAGEGLRCRAGGHGP